MSNARLEIALTVDVDRLRDRLVDGCGRKQCAHLLAHASDHPAIALLVGELSLGLPGDVQHPGYPARGVDVGRFVEHSVKRSDRAPDERFERLSVLGSHLPAVGGEALLVVAGRRVVVVPGNSPADSVQALEVEDDALDNREPRRERIVRGQPLRSEDQRSDPVDDVRQARLGIQFFPLLP